MSVLLDPRLRYDMPAMFGASPVPERTYVPRASAFVLSFRTSRDAAESLVPQYFEVPESPLVSVSHMTYRGVDYLGGRDYNEVVISVGASHKGESETIEAAFAVVLWVNQPGALIAGREFMGLAKLIGVIPDLTVEDSDARFTCGEYSATLIAGSATNLTPMDDTQLEKLNRRASIVRTFGWKYIASASGGSDVDYPTVNVMQWTYESGRLATGSLELFMPERAAAPMSAAALQRLAKIPRLSAIRAFHGIGSAIIDRTGTRRL